MPVCEKCHRDAPEGALFCAFCGQSIKPPTSPGQELDLLIGQTVGGKYFIHQLLGHGGMGDVYKATHLTLDRPVVLKLLKKHFLSDPSLVQRFHREARAASRLNHPNSITIIDFGQTEDGTLFIAMEYLAGRSLERVIAEDGPLDEPRAVHIGAQILAALAEAHALGIIHRDLKPANVMIESRRDETDFVKVLDFGIAKLNEPGGGASITQAGIVCGTPGYMSTEQVRGEELDARSDLYGVGVILFEMLTGVLPFDADTPMGLVTKHLVEEPPRPAARRPGLVVSPALEALIMRALARDRNDRFGSAEEMRAALLSCAPGAAPSIRPTPPPTTVIFDSAVLTPAKGARPMVAGRPAAAERTPAPARKTPPQSRPARHEMDEESGEEPAPPPPHRSRRSMAFAAAGVAAAALLGGVVWLAMREPAAEPTRQVKVPQPVPAPPAPEQSQAAPPPTQAAPTPPSSAPTPPQPAPTPPKLAPAQPPPPPAPRPAPAKPVAAPVRTVQCKKGIRDVGEGLNSVATPPESSCDGVLTVDATPWAIVVIDGREIGETPREVRLGAGTYRVRASHPALGTREQTVTIQAGKRRSWSPTFAK
jgi:serine/threonine-protein kinase